MKKLLLLLALNTAISLWSMTIDLGKGEFDSVKLGTDGKTFLYHRKDPFDRRSDSWRLYNLSTDRPEMMWESAVGFKRLAAGYFARAHFKNFLSSGSPSVEIISSEHYRGDTKKLFLEHDICRIQESHNAKLLMVAGSEGDISLFRDRDRIMNGSVHKGEDLMRMEFNATDDLVAFLIKGFNQFSENYNEISLFDLRKGLNKPLQQIKSYRSRGGFTFSGNQCNSDEYIFNGRGKICLLSARDILFDQEVFKSSASFDEYFSTPDGTFYMTSSEQTYKITPEGDLMELNNLSGYSCIGYDCDTDNFFCSNDKKDWCKIRFPSHLEDVYKVDGTVQCYNAATQQIAVTRGQYIDIHNVNELTKFEEHDEHND